MGDLLAWLASAFQSVVTFFEGLPLHILTSMMSGLAAVVNWFPVPSWYADAPGWIGSMPALAAYLLSALQIGTLVTILVSAYTIRFLIRRIFFLN